MTEAPSTDEPGTPAQRAGVASAAVKSAAAESAAAGGVGRQDTRRTWIWFASFVAAIALVVALVWAAGGFEHRDDLATVIDDGQTFSNGPFELSFTKATVQKTSTYDDKIIWTVVIIGAGRTTGDQSIQPDRDLFVVKDARSGAYQEESERQEFGPSERSGGSKFTPGLAAVPYRVVYQFPVDSFTPDKTIIFAAWRLEWRDVSLLHVGDYEWASTHDYLRMDLPLRRLPDDVRS